MDIRAFEEKATTLRQRALAISRGQGADIAEAEDIAQEVMLRLWQMLDDIKDTARMERLSAVMARNMTIDMLRKRRTMPLCGNEVRFVALHDTPDESLEAAEEESWLRQRLRQLPKFFAERFFEYRSKFKFCRKQHNCKTVAYCCFFVFFGLSLFSVKIFYILCFTPFFFTL